MLLRVYLAEPLEQFAAQFILDLIKYLVGLAKKND